MANRNNKGTPPSRGNQAGFIPGVAPMLRPNKPAISKGPPNPVVTGAPISGNTQAKTLLQPQISKSSRRTKKKTNTAYDVAQNAAFAYAMGDDSSSSSSDSFMTDDRRGSFPIYSGRSDFVTCNFECKTVVDTITDDYLFDESDQERSVKQHISIARFFPDPAISWTSLPDYSVVKDQFANTYDRWTSKIQEIRLNTTMYNFWSKDLVYKYIITVIEALSIYVTLDSILAIDEPVGEVNRCNPVMKTYYNDPDLLVAQDALRRKLSNQWLPVKMRHLILWIYQLYQTAELRTSHQYRFVPHYGFVRIIDDADPLDSAAILRTRINELITQMDSLDNTRIRSVLRSTLPEGCINSIPFACNRPSFDRKHHEIFANQPVLTRANNSTNNVFPKFDPGARGYIAYGMSVDPEVNNGFAFALSQNYEQNNGPAGYFTPDSDIFNALRYNATSLDDPKDFCNQWSADANKFNAGDPVWIRNTVLYKSNFDEAGYINLVEQDAQGNQFRKSITMPFGYQRVYFDSYNQRLLIAKEVFRDLLTA